MSGGKNHDGQLHVMIDAMATSSKKMEEFKGLEAEIFLCRFQYCFHVGQNAFLLLTISP